MTLKYLQQTMFLNCLFNLNKK